MEAQVEPANMLRTSALNIKPKGQLLFFPLCYHFSEDQFHYLFQVTKISLIHALVYGLLLVQ